ncbi:PLP-dependent transferase [Aspergillus steynii IBT 23096]|uniref:PLP-dependent transferase n=1 Tax=Aspergillus steynii IBT 23096 TaxID=1392250 RepID=A0A2I2GAH9_9EURO|nr:PLP-dependent transferase [Aspergillus steynii IBT 23096]PLB49868.1 PLP-dependent transferase [Aspergillus steynii IBT 23096]
MTRSQETAPTSFGHEMRKHFSFAPGYRNLNHGSYGTSPSAVRKKAENLREEWETRPCPFIKYDFPPLLDESRAAIADFLQVPVSTVVFVANATTGVNTVLRNLTWNPDGNDEIIQLDVIYSACGSTTKYLCEASECRVRTREVRVDYPIEDDEFVAAFRNTIRASRREGRNPRIAIFDTVCSNPGLRLPFEALTAVCREEGVLSLIDGAHGIGHIELNLAQLDPDFFVSNCHKWLFTPRSCAVFYVPQRNQAMMRSTLPTSIGFVPQSESTSNAPAVNTDKSEFVRNFEFVGTLDTIPFITVPAAIEWRRTVAGGEKKIIEYCTRLAQEGGRLVADILGTQVLDNKTRTYTDCCMSTVLLPIELSTSAPVTLPWKGRRVSVSDWAQQTLIEEYQTYLPIFPFKGRWWTRLSGQIYLEMDDFEWAGHTLVELCERLKLALSEQRTE